MSLGFGCFAAILSIVHHYKYSYDGLGFPYLEYVTVSFEMISESIMTVLCFLLADGWMTYWIKFDFLKKQEIYAPLFTIILLVHLLMGALTFIDYGTSGGRMFNEPTSV